eukprot:scaffold3175_cov309-Prasinococcus_capsulatus_cf.AAC.3
MDFTTIRKKVARRKYPTWKLFRADIELLCNNACIYNEAHTVFHQQAKAILEEAKTLVSDCAAGGTMATVLVSSSWRRCRHAAHSLGSLRPCCTWQANRDRSEAEKAEQEQLRKEQLRGLRRDKSEKSLLSTPALSSGYETRRGADSGIGAALRSKRAALLSSCVDPRARLPARLTAGAALAARPDGHGTEVRHRRGSRGGLQLPCAADAGERRLAPRGRTRRQPCGCAAPPDGGGARSCSCGRARWPAGVPNVARLLAVVACRRNTSARAT